MERAGGVIKSNVRTCKGEDGGGERYEWVRGGIRENRVGLWPGGVSGDWRI